MGGSELRPEGAWQMEELESRGASFKYAEKLERFLTQQVCSYMYIVPLCHIATYITYVHFCLLYKVIGNSSKFKIKEPLHFPYSPREP